MLSTEATSAGRAGIVGTATCFPARACVAAGGARSGVTPRRLTTTGPSDRQIIAAPGGGTRNVLVLKLGGISRVVTYRRPTPMPIVIAIAPSPTIRPYKGSTNLIPFSEHTPA